MKYFETDDGVKLAYTDRGSGVCVVLIAGYGAPAVSWCCQERALLKAGYRVICFDRRCHGRSEAPSFGQNMLRHGQDINCLIEHLKLSDAILVGQSQGASAIFSYISQFGTSRLSGICGIDQTPKMLNDGDWNYGMYGLNADTQTAFFDAPLGKPNNVPFDRRIVANVILRSIGMRKFDTVRAKPLLLDHAGRDWRQVLSKLKIPAFFIAGENSPYWRCEHAEVSSALCKNGAFAVVDGSGHAVNWEFPDRVNELLLQFASTMPTWKALEGNSAQYAAESFERQFCTLSGKRVLFLGSSVTNGAGADCQSFVEMLEHGYGISAVKEAVNGTTLVDSGPMSYIKRLRKLDTGERYDAFVCQLSTNDAARGFQPDEIDGAIENIVSYVNSMFDCPVLFYTSPKFNSFAYAAMVKRLHRLSDTLGFGVADLWSECDLSQLTAHQRRLYFADPVHPTRAGYATLFVPVLKAKLEEMLTQ